MPETESPLLRWLHLTDLHIGKNDESQRTALSTLLSSVTHFAKGKPFDVVLLTGDLAYSGKREEYDALEKILIQPLRASPLFKSSRLIATPGNHDLDCDVEYPPSWNNLGASRRERFFYLGDDGRKTRGSRAQAFAEYQSFVSRCSLDSVDPTKEPAAVFSVDDKSKPIIVVSTVTAYFSDKEVLDRQKAPAPLHAIRTLTDPYRNEAQVIVIGHHPPEWFLPDSEQHLHTFLVEKNALYLHGHEHRIRSKFGARGLATLGFGAAYQASHESPPTPHYRNSFAICELTSSLHVCVVSWDAVHGQWRPDQNLPGDFIERSDRLADGYQLALPTTKLSDRARPYASIGAAIREDVQIDRCLWLGTNSPARWTQLLRTLGLIHEEVEPYALPTQSLATGHVEFRINNSDGRYLIHAISAHGDVLNYEQLQAINTELDRQDYDGCIVATLGELSSDARTLATQLASRKTITVLEKTDLVRRSIRHLPPPLERALFAASDVDALAGCLIFTNAGFSLLLSERTMYSWFRVIDENGAVLPESSELVIAMRSETPALRQLKYDSGGGSREGSSAQAKPTSAPFDRRLYLEKCLKYFDDVKYAPLAALGFRFRKASLSDIYVEASADVGGSTKISHNLTRAVNEFVESLQLPKAQQDQLEAQLRSRFGLNRSVEVGAARKFYQRYNNVVVLGDPGSGKTCFVQYEILAYCSPSPEADTWYSRHLPVYVSLAEAARLLDGATHMLTICEIVSSRRGIDLPRSAIENALADGQAAFFFDGLDEVGYLDKRIALLAEIADLVKAYAGRGNRFVLASRPAAVQPVDIPEGLTYLQLKGLTEEEIRTLAGRVLTSRIGESELGEIAPEERELVERLIDDTRSQPGIARIARNPLLLTLLVLIYANSGAISARRHLIYTQAIKTLVSVRGRQTRDQQISEADLRSRLGALALAIFRRRIAEIPRRAEVVALLTPLMQRPAIGGTEVSVADAANSFIQEVAEATGLLAIHADQDGNTEELITFMHYSFLEYYAAAGLLSQDFRTIVPDLSGNPRWRDVITLLFGMLSEQGDVTPLLGEILQVDSPDEAISRYRTVLALDCANECDVPPEQSQALLASVIYEAVATGAGRFTADLRADIASRLDHFLQGSGLRIERALIHGLRESDPVAAAAFADLVARIGPEVRLSAEMIEAFDDFLQHEEPVARTTAMFAIESRPEFRTASALKCVKTTLKGNVAEKHGALKVVAAVPAFGDSLRLEVRAMLDDPNDLISSGAAQCLLADALKRHQAGDESAAIDKIVSRLGHEAGEQAGLALPGITLDKEIVQSLVFSDNESQSELAIRHLSLMQGHSQFVYETLLRRMRMPSSPRQISAILDALRESAGAIDLITIADTDAICAYLQRPQRNVRIAAIGLLGEMPDDEQVIQALRDHLERVAERPAQQEELTVTARALAKHVRRNERLRASTLSRLLALLPSSAKEGFGAKPEQRLTLALLSVCESIGGTTDDRAAWKLKRLADDFRTPIDLRVSATRVFGRLVEPSLSSAKAIAELLRLDDLRLNDSRYAAAAAFFAQSKRRVEFVRRIYQSLAPLRECLSDAWRRETSRSKDSINAQGLKDIRDSAEEVANLIVSYEEFSGRATVT